MFTIFTQKYLCLILFQTHLCDPLQLLIHIYFVIVGIYTWLKLYMYVHINMRLHTVTYMTTTTYLKKSYVYVDI